MADLHIKFLENLWESPMHYKSRLVIDEQNSGSAISLSDRAKLSLYKKSVNSGISANILEEVYSRGYSIWNESFGGTPEQFAFDRVNSFISGGFAADLDEDLRQWFSPSHPKGGWKRYNSKGEAIGPCAREPGEPKPKCMSNEKAASLSKKERASAVAAKRRHDPNPERKGKPINVSNYGKGKISEMTEIYEENKPTNPSLWSKAKALARQKFDVYPSAYANGWAAKWYKSKGGGWKSIKEDIIDEELLNKKTPSADQIAKKFDKTISQIRKVVNIGTKVEKEHTKKTKLADEIARDHIGERPDYYKLLKQMEKKPMKEDRELEEACWDGYKQSGMKKKGNRMVPNCVPVEEQRTEKQIHAAKHFKTGETVELQSTDPNDPDSRFDGTKSVARVYRKMTPGQNVTETIRRVVRETVEELEEVAAWQRKEGKSPSGGLNRKGIESYRRENPGSKLSMAVTTKPSKLKKGGKAWNRRKSFCARMSGMKGPMKDEKGRPTRKALSLRKWNCEETITEVAIRDAAGKIKTLKNVKIRGIDNKIISAPPGHSSSHSGGDEE